MNYRAADPSLWWELVPVFPHVAAVTSVRQGALRECWLHPRVSWWPHLGIVAAKNHKETTTLKYGAGADMVSVPHCILNSDYVSRPLWLFDQY